MTEEKVIRIQDLKLYFTTNKGVVQAVDGVNFDLMPTKAVVVVGESGCGKTSLAKAVLRLLPEMLVSTPDKSGWVIRKRWLFQTRNIVSKSGGFKCPWFLRLP